MAGMEDSMSRRQMTRWLRIGQWGVFAGVGAPLVLLQTGCLLGDPDIALQAGLQTLTEIGIFLLDNLVNAAR